MFTGQLCEIEIRSRSKRMGPLHSAEVQDTMPDSAEDRRGRPGPATNHTSRSKVSGLQILVVYVQPTDRQDPRVTSSEDEAGKKIEDTQIYLIEMVRGLFGSDDLDGNAKNASGSGSEGIEQTSVVPYVCQQRESRKLESSNGR